MTTASHSKLELLNIAAVMVEISLHQTVITEDFSSKLHGLFAINKCVKNDHLEVLSILLGCVYVHIFLYTDI